MQQIKLEICIDSVAGALAAQRGGADRLELCSALSEGGLTPSSGLVRSVLAATNLPIMVMIRPRGGDYEYCGHEVDAMLGDIAVMRELGVHGVVFGTLDESRAVDLATCRTLIAAAKPLSLTFHRAFDVCERPDRALEQLIELGFDRVLTSGQCGSAEEGISALRRFVELADERIVIMPGCGVRPENAARIIRETQATEIHGTASSWIEGQASAPSELLQPPPRRVTAESVVREMRVAVDSV